MGFRSVQFYGFRNLEDGEIHLDAENVFFIGENGQGKTNFLEALYILSYGGSFRTRQEKEMMCWGKKEMSLHGRLAQDNGPDNRLSVTWKDGSKTIRLHDKVVTDRKSLLRLMPVIAFVHDDFLFAEGPPERRRWFVDQTLSLHDPLYIDQLRRFRKILRERNYLLKTKNHSLMDHYGEQLAFAGLALMERRASLKKDFCKVFTPLYREISGLNADVTLEYKPSWAGAETTEEVLAILHGKKELDFITGSTGTGPHRDRFVFVSEGRDFTKTASTGQKRLVSLVLRAAQARFFTEITGTKPVLLLDDVLLELDPEKRRLFTERLPESRQNFYTFLPGEKILSNNSRALRYTVRKGCLYAE